MKPTKPAIFILTALWAFLHSCAERDGSFTAESTIEGETVYHIDLEQCIQKEDNFSSLQCHNSAYLRKMGFIAKLNSKINIIVFKGFY